MDNRATKYAIGLWIIFIIATCVMVTIQGFSHSVLHDYFHGVERWVSGLALYRGGKGFIYFPQSAILFIPFYYLPHAAAEIGWRIISLTLLGFALLRLANNFKINYLALTLFAIPLAYASARNGQFNLILTVMMLLAVVAVKRENWWQATLFLVLGFALKPTIIVLLLLMWTLHKKLWFKIPLGLIIMLALPFVLQHPSYVLQQYLGVGGMLNATGNVGSLNPAHWAQFFGLLAQMGASISRYNQTIVRLVMAVLACGYCIWQRKKWPKQNFPMLLFTVAACYLLLFNPRTENNDYVILAPALGYFACLYHKYGKFIKLALTVNTGLFILASRWLLNLGSIINLGVLMTVVFTILIVTTNYRTVANDSTAATS